MSISLKKLTTSIAVILGIGLVALLVLYNAFSWGYVTFMLYNWFILPSFPTSPHFGVLAFVGFNIFLNAIIRSSPSHIKSEYQNQTSMWVTTLLAPWLTLFVSWCLYHAYFIH